MKWSAIVLAIALLTPGVEAAASAPSGDSCYYYRGHHYRYYHRGHYYRYHWHGSFYNRRYRCGPHWCYR
jgi:hypothetical protein